MSIETVNMEINSKNKEIYELIKYIIDKVDYVNSNNIQISKDVLSLSLEFCSIINLPRFALAE